MQEKKTKLHFTAKIWQYNGPNGWYFVSLPQDLSKEIREACKDEEQGWGRLPAKAEIGQTTWETAIWFDTKQNTYLLPLKADVRKKQKLGLDDAVNAVIWV